MPSSRSLRIALIAAGVLLFLIVSGLLARWLSTENVERDAELNLLKAQAAGNVASMLAQLDPSCRATLSCRATQAANATRLRRTGAVKILLVNSATAYTLTSKTGVTRLAWTVIGRLPVVQCVQVRRSGNALSGLSVTLLRLSAPISSTGVCTSSS